MCRRPLRRFAVLGTVFRSVALFPLASELTEIKPACGWTTIDLEKKTPRSTREAAQATIDVVAELPGAEPRRYVILAQIR